jgi:hypothetical protein
VDSAGLAWLFVQGNSGNTHDPNPTVVPTAGDVMSEPRFVSVSLSGDVLIACNDAGFIRVVKNVLPPPAAPLWDPASKLTGQGMDLRWKSVSGRWYYLESTDSLEEASWSPLAALPSTGEMTNFVDTAALTRKRSFYRVRSFRSWPN